LINQRLIWESGVQDPEAEDAAQIVRTLAVHRHCGSQVRVIVELLKPEKAASAIWDDTDQAIEIMCLDVIRFKLLARRYLCSFSPFAPELNEGLGRSDFDKQ
jgi:potassium large conductance calcium-activated channel subfamily M alpha protein 1